MFFKHEKIQQLHQLIHHAKPADYSDAPDWCAYGFDMTADVLQNIADSGITDSGEFAVSMGGLGLRLISKIIRLYTLYKERRLDFDWNTFWAIADMMMSLIVGVSIIMLSEFARLILEVIFSVYCVFRDAIDLNNLRNEYKQIQHFDIWLYQLKSKTDEELTAALTDDYKIHNQAFIEELFIRDIVLKRAVRREALSDILQKEYADIQYLVKKIGPYYSEKVYALRYLYRQQDALFQELRIGMLQWEPGEAIGDIKAIHSELEHIIHRINLMIGHHRLKLMNNGNMALQDMHEQFWDCFMNINISVCALILATLALVACLCFAPQSLVFFVVPLILEVLVGMLLLSRVVLELVFSWQEGCNLELEILEKAAEGLPEPEQALNIQEAGYLIEDSICLA